MKHLCPWCDYDGVDLPSESVRRDLEAACNEVKWIEEHVESARRLQARALDPHAETFARQQAEAAERLADITRDNMRRWLGIPTLDDGEIVHASDLLYGSTKTT